MSGWDDYIEYNIDESFDGVSQKSLGVSVKVTVCRGSFT